MVVELFGCTSAGKSSLARRLVGAVPAAWRADDFALARAGLGWLPGRLTRLVALDLLALGACLGARHRRREFFRCAWSCLRRLPAELSLARRLNVARNVFKVAGIREIAERAPREALLLLDEGTLQSAHYLFVQPYAEPDLERLGGFLARVPLPDVAVYLREEEPTLVRRTLARGHPRIPQRSPEATRLFLARAERVFAAIAGEARVQDRLLVVDAARGTPRSAAPRPSADLERALAWIRASAGGGAERDALGAEAAAG